MESGILHFLIPFVLLRIINHLTGDKIDNMLILLLSPFAVLPDGDLLLRGLHRAAFHNLVFGALAITAAWFLLRKRFNSKHIIFIASVFFLTHMVLDGGGVLWFYPLTDQSFNLSGQHVNLASLQPGYKYRQPSVLLFHLFSVIAAFLVLLFLQLNLSKKKIKDYLPKL